MKASEAIDRLAVLIIEHGDLELDMVHVDSGWRQGGVVIEYQGPDQHNDVPTFTVMPKSWDHE